MIDLYSDTHTLPSDGMRRAMAEAEVGDEQMGEDPTTRQLEATVAELLDVEASMFMPTGSMCNKVAVAALSRPGDALVCDALAHVYRFEAGGSAVLSGTVFEPIVTEKGIFTPEQLTAVMNPGSVYQPRTSVVSIEQTHNFGGGVVWSLDEYEAVCATARDHDAAIFVDGARLLNAVAASGVPAQAWARSVDAVWIDCSKGVGAPGGAVIAGSAAFIEAAQRFKYMYGGAMRQSGILAAAALYGLEHNVPRLPEDHQNAKTLAAGLTDAGLIVGAPESNMVFCEAPGTLGLEGFRAAMAREGIRVSSGAGRARFVTHVGITAADIDEAVAAARRVLS